MSRPTDPGIPQGVTTICPECHGVLSERNEAGVPQWECRVGHRYSVESLIEAQAEDVEAALWAAVRALEDRRLLLERMAGQMERSGQRHSARSFQKRAEEAAGQEQAVRSALARAAATSLRDLDDDERDGPRALGGEVG